MIRKPESKIVTDPATLGEKLRAEKKTIVSTNGCFDILHWGHLKYLSDARHQGDVLVVGLNSDRSVKTIKGPLRPILDEKTRALQLASLEAVDYVIIFEESTPENFLTKLRSHIHVKGADYEGKDLPELKVMKAVGGEVKFVPLVPNLSTSKILEKLTQL